MQTNLAAMICIKMSPTEAKHLLKIVDMGVTEHAPTRHVIVTPMMQAEDLHSLYAKGALSPQELLACIAQVLEGLRNCMMRALSTGNTTEQSARCEERQGTCRHDR